MLTVSSCGKWRGRWCPPPTGKNPPPWTTETHYQLFAVQPFAAVEADFNITASEYGTGMIEWMSGDGTRRITVSATREGA